MKQDTQGAVDMNIAVIGGAGRMGGWLVRYFSSRGHRIIISDVKLDEARASAEATRVEFAKNNVEAVKNVDLVVVSTPIQATPQVIHEIAPHAREGAIVAEISSFKALLVKALAETAKQNVRPLSIHPLFGPGARKVKGRKIAVIPILNLEAEKKLTKELFPEAEIIVVDAEKHDKVMALTIALPHFINIAFASIISYENIGMLKKLEGPTFKLQKTLAESMMTEDPTFLASILLNNVYASPYFEQFLSKAKIMKKWITDKNMEKLTKLCGSVRNVLSKDADFAESYEKMYRILEIL